MKSFTEITKEIRERTCNDYSDYEYEIEIYDNINENTEVVLQGTFEEVYKEWEYINQQGYTSSWDEDFAYAQLNLRYSESEMDSHEVLDTYER